MKIMVRFDIDVAVELPEAEDDENIVDDDDEVLPEAEKRAIEAAICAFPETVDIYIDGPDKPPTNCSFDVTDNHVTECITDD
jgi:hypothetical protein